MISRRTLILASLSGLFIQSTHAETLHGRFFVVVWGYEGASGDPADAHTFATFYRGDDLSHGRVLPAAISWLPATGVVKSFGIEKGKNFALAATLALARRHDYTVAAFGPYEISAENYAHALERIRQLNSGSVAYTMINGPDGAMNCIEAVGSVGGPISTGASYGLSASETVARHLS